MSVGNWTPGNTSGGTQEIDQDFLKHCMDIAQRDALEHLPQLVSPDDQARHSSIVLLPQSTWTTALADFSNDELRLLIRFFVCAERLLSGWEAGSNSPAIWANKLLKSRGARLDQNELVWIRANTDNRFIPNGGL